MTTTIDEILRANRKDITLWEACSFPNGSRYRIERLKEGIITLNGEKLTIRSSYGLGYFCYRGEVDFSELEWRNGEKGWDYYSLSTGDPVDLPDYVIVPFDRKGIGSGSQSIYYCNRDQALAFFEEVCERKLLATQRTEQQVRDASKPRQDRGRGNKRNREK